MQDDLNVTPTNTENNPAPEMGWYNFVTYVQLPLAMIIDAVSAIRVLLQEGSNSYLTVYKVCTVIVMLSFILFAAVVHRDLINMQKRAVNELMINYVVTTIFSAIQTMILIRFATGDFSSLFGLLIGRIIILVVSKTYFDKRMHLFINEDNKYFIVRKAFLPVIVTFSVVLFIDTSLIYINSNEINDEAYISDDFYDESNTSDEIYDEVNSSDETYDEVNSSDVTFNDSNSSDGFSAITTGYPFAEYNDNTYISNALGIGCTLPSSFTYYTNGEMARKDGAPSANFKDNFEKDIYLSKLRSEMIADNNENNDQIRVSVCFFGDQTYSLFEELNIDDVIDPDIVKDAFQTEDIEIQDKKTDFCGHEAKEYDLIANYPKREIVFINDEFIGYYITSSLTAENIEENVNYFFAVQTP